MQLSPTRQRNAVAEGVALGLVLNGSSEITARKFDVDRAVVHAMEGWADSDKFPTVVNELRRSGNGYRLLNSLTKSKATSLFFWESQRGALVVNRRDATWDASDPEEVAFAAEVVGGGLSGNAWRVLGASLLRELSRPDNRTGT